MIPLVDERQSAGAVPVWVGIGIAGQAVGGPAGMTDSQRGPL